VAVDVSELLSVDEIKGMLGIESTIALCRLIRDGSIPQPIIRYGPPTWNPEEVARAVARNHKE
jgi:hypothetical protein